ncbi:hypothetical protein HPB47_003652 [Ixodes persulcatus]|uniref:Uncharacterized protein n=1 Tax=Ixodes persulcatus TaxID=34615 RepID=A0AC60PHX6_IXOPE|nr:hypothetical protein HPB47_003652 [Ixodes persulcatus]
MLIEIERGRGGDCAQDPGFSSASFRSTCSELVCARPLGHRSPNESRLGDRVPSPLQEVELETMAEDADVVDTATATTSPGSPTSGDPPPPPPDPDRRGRVVAPVASSEGPVPAFPVVLEPKEAGGGSTLNGHGNPDREVDRDRHWDRDRDLNATKKGAEGETPSPTVDRRRSSEGREEQSEEEKIREYLGRSDTAVIYPEPVEPTKAPVAPDGEADKERHVVRSHGATNAAPAPAESPGPSDASAGENVAWRHRRVSTGKQACVCGPHIPRGTPCNRAKEAPKPPLLQPVSCVRGSRDVARVGGPEETDLAGLVCRSTSGRLSPT